jgi:DNA polymerase III subunit epsilon
MLTFVALDFETATYARDSACELAMVRVEDGRAAAETSYLIRPPTPEFHFTYLHGIDWPMVENAPTFAEVMPQVRKLCEGADFLAAHYAPFDKGVMAATCARYRLAPPPQPYVCTVRLSRAVWSIYPTKLDNVCDALGIGLERHHRAGFDARACAEIVIKGLDEIGEDAFRARYL